MRTSMLTALRKGEGSAFDQMMQECLRRYELPAKGRKVVRIYCKIRLKTVNYAKKFE